MFRLSVSFVVYDGRHDCLVTADLSLEGGWMLSPDDVTWSISTNIQYLFGGLVVGQCLIMCVVWMCELTALGRVVRACVRACVSACINVH